MDIIEDWHQICCYVAPCRAKIFLAHVTQHHVIPDKAAPDESSLPRGRSNAVDNGFCYFRSFRLLREYGRKL